MNMHRIFAPVKRALIAFLSLLSARLSALSILMYHSVSDSGAFFSVSPESFRRQMRYIRDSGFDAVFASEIAERIRSGDLARTVCVTFDDGYEDVYTNAFPILKEFRVKASVFLITNQIGGSYTNSEGRTFPLLKEGEIREMQTSGLVEFMPHGHTHKKLHQLTGSEQEEEIAESTAVIEALTGSKPRVFAYPRGRTTPAIAKMLESSGYALGLGVLPGLVRADSDRYDVPRNAVDTHTGFREFKLKLSNAIEWYVALARMFKRKGI